MDWRGIAFVSGFFATVVYLLYQAWRGRHGWLTSGWAEARGLPLTEENRGFVLTYVRRTRSLRLAGGLISYLGPVVYFVWTERTPPGVFADTAWLWVLGGYLMGALVAEVTIPRPREEGDRQAALRPRELPAYLPARVTWSMWILAFIAIGLTPIYGLVPLRVQRVSDAAFFALGVAAVILAAGVEAFQRFIVRRAQPFISTDLLRADDVLRSASINALAAAGIGLILLILAYQVSTIGVSTDVQGLRWLGWAGFAGWLAAMIAWIRLSRPEKLRPGRIKVLGPQT
jgi:hypothetical protein